MPRPGRQGATHHASVGDLLGELKVFSSLEQTLAFHIRAAGLPDPQPEHRFWPGRRFRFDLAWPSRLVACEVEGGSWVGGRHTQGQGYEADCIKYSEAAIRGWLVIRVTGAMIDDGRALGLVERALAARKEVP